MIDLSNLSTRDLIDELRKRWEVKDAPSTSVHEIEPEHKARIYFDETSNFYFPLRGPATIVLFKEYSQDELRRVFG